MHGKESTLSIKVQYYTCFQIALSLAILLEAKPLNSRSCGGKAADVVFVLDVSSSIWPKHFREHMLTFVHEVVDSLHVGPGVDQARVGAVTFSDEVWLEFHLNQFMDKDQLLERVAKVTILSWCFE